MVNRCWFSAWLTVAAVFLGAAAPPPIWGDLQAGKYSVGVEALPVPASGNGVRATIWRPTDASSKLLTLGELVTLVCGDRSEAPAACLADTRDQLKSGGEAQADARLQELLRATVYARAATTGTAGRQRFPVVVLEGANASRGADFLILAEYLSSWGYVVATIGDVPPAPPPYDAARARQKAERIKDTLRLLSSHPYADTGRVGAVTWSFGGAVVPLVMQDDPRFRAEASLDSGFNYAYGGAILREVSPSLVEPGRCTPLMHLLPGVGNRVAKDDSYAKASGLTYSAIVPGFAHGSFSDQRGALTSFASGGETWKDFAPTYASTARAVRLFLDAYVKNDRGALAELEKASIAGQALTLSRGARCLT